jgi:hypothetical protein
MSRLLGAVELGGTKVAVDRDPLGPLRSTYIRTCYPGSTLNGVRGFLAEARGRRDLPGTFGGDHSGGIAGGISTGTQIVVRAALKQTPPIRRPLQTIGRSGAELEISTTGRHDPCVGIRAAPVVEAMAAFVPADHKLLQRGRCG